MKLTEFILAAATGLCGLTAAATAFKYPKVCDLASGAGLFLCSIWLLMRTL